MGQLGVRRAQVAAHSRRQASHRSAAVDGGASHCAWCSRSHSRPEAKVIYAPRVGLPGAETGGQVLLFAIEQPDDDTQLIVGMEKANAPPAYRQPSTGKCTRSLVAAREVWAVEEITTHSD